MIKRFLPYILTGTAIAISLACACRHHALMMDIKATTPTDNHKSALIQRTVQIQALLSKQRNVSWAARIINTPVHSDLRFVKFLDLSTGWIAGSERVLYRTRDAGKTWTRIQLPTLPESDIVSLSFVNTEDGWVLLQKNAKNLIDFDANESWLIHTRDGGKTWLTTYHGVATTMARVLFVDENLGWLVGMRWIGNERETQSYVVLHTSDQGEHWSDSSAKLVGLVKASPDVTRPQDVFQDGITNVFASPTSKAVLVSLRGLVLRNADGRENWETVGSIANEPEQTAITQISVANDDLWIAGGGHSIEGTWGVLARLDKDHWTKYVLSGVYLTDAIHVSSNEIVACGSIVMNTPTDQGLNKTAGLIFYSSDGGHHWSTVYLNKNVRAISSLALTNSSQAWAVGDGGLLLNLKFRAKTRPRATE